MIGVLSGIWHVIASTWQNQTVYSFVSGPLADVTLLGGAIAIVRKHTCHIHGCWRLGRHAVDGTPYVVCPKHHPDVPDKVRPHHLTPS